MHIGSRLASKTPFFYGWVIVGAAGASQFARNAVASLTLSVFIYPMAQDLGWSRTLIAGAASVGGLAAMGASPITGWLIDRYGARIVLSVSVAVLGLSTMSLTWATTPTAFYLAYASARVVFSSPIHLGASVVVTRWFARRRGRATGMLFATQSAGMTLFPVIASVMIHLRGWQDTWLILGVLVWVIALAPVSLLTIDHPEDIGLRPDGDVSSGLPTSREAAQFEEDWTLREALRARTLWIIAVAGGLLFLVQSGTNIHMAAYFRDQGLGTAIAATAISLNAIFTGIGALAWGWAVERVPVRYVFAGVALSMMAAAAMLVLADTPGTGLASASLFGISVGGILVLPPVAYANYFGRANLGAIRGATEPLITLGQAAGAVLSGAIFESSGTYRLAFLIFVALAAITMVGLLWATPPHRRRPPGL